MSSEEGDAVDYDYKHSMFYVCDYIEAHEVFVGGLGQDITESDLQTVFERVGHVIGNRIIKSQGVSKGYAFIGYETQKEVEEAVRMLHHTQIKDSIIELRIGKTNNTLFCVGIKKTWTDKRVDELFRNTVANVVKVIVLPDAKNQDLNRGYLFVRFDNHQNALKALNRINKEEFLLGGYKIQANWADTQNNFDEDEGINRKALYVTPIDISISTDNLKDVFSKYGEVNQIVLARELPNTQRDDFAFINFDYEDDAQRALLDKDNIICNNVKLNVSHARKPDRVAKNNRKQQTTPIMGNNVFHVSGMNYPYGPVVSPAYKTRLCRHFQSGKKCQHGDMCQYAHGESELRQINGNYSYSPMNMPPPPPPPIYTALYPIPLPVVPGIMPPQPLQRQSPTNIMEKQKDSERK